MCTTSLHAPSIYEANSPMIQVAFKPLANCQGGYHLEKAVRLFHTLRQPCNSSSSWHAVE